MNKPIGNVLYYGIFGALATAISFGMVPQAFAVASPLTAGIVYGVLMALAMFACNKLELHAWSTFAAGKGDSMAWRLLVRLGIYLGGPAVLLWVVGFTGVFLLPAGFLTALALTWMPLMIGALLNYFPARAR
jgi:hypothetical protein